MPTLQEQLELPAVPGLQGTSLLGRIRGGELAKPSARSEAVKAGPEQKALYQGPYKLIRAAGASSDRLFDRRHDSGEERDVAAEAPAALRELQAELARQLAADAELARQVSRQSRSIGAEMRRRLEALGYLDEDPR